MRWPGWRASCAPAYQYTNNQDCKNLCYGKHFIRKSTATVVCLSFWHGETFWKCNTFDFDKRLATFSGPTPSAATFPVPRLDLQHGDRPSRHLSFYSADLCDIVESSWIDLLNIVNITHSISVPSATSFLHHLKRVNSCFAALLECRVQVRSMRLPSGVTNLGEDHCSHCHQENPQVQWRHWLLVLSPCADKTSNLVTQKIQHSELSLGFCECAGSVEH